MADDWHAPTQRAANFVVTAAVWNELMDDLDALKSVVMGDAQATAELIHQHKYGTLANRPTPGNAGRIYIPSDLRVLLIDDGTEWLIGPPIGPDCEAFDDDFAAYGTDTGAAETWGIWGTSVAGTGSIVVNPGSALRSAVECRTGATSGGTCILRNKPSNGWQVAQQTFLLVMTFKVSASAANSAYMLGFTDTAPGYPGNPANGIYLYKFEAGNVFAVIANASSRTTQDLGWDGTTYKTVIMEHDAGTPNVKVYTDTFNAGGLQGTLSGADMPPVATQLLLQGQARDNDNTDRRLVVDDIQLRRVRG